jgi:protease-4
MHAAVFFLADFPPFGRAVKTACTIARMSSFPPPPPTQSSSGGAGSGSSFPPGPLTANASRSDLPPSRTVVEVVAKRGGLGQAILFLVTVGIVAGAFFVGILFGAVAALAPSEGTGLPLESVVRDGTGGDKIAIIAVEGAIDNQSSDEVTSAVAHVLADSDVRGVVLRVDSPGGAVSPSDRIWRDIERLRSRGLPVVASYGGVAASGGVYISCGADHIVCEPTSVTGSVGVIASVLTFGGLMEKVGVEPVTIVASQSPRKDDANDPYRVWEASDRAVVQGMLDSSYDLFVDRVMAGRTGKASNPDKLRSVLDGRIFTADEALDVGLVDSVGYLDDAIAEVERQTGLTPGSASVVRLFEPRSLFGDGFLGVRSGENGSQLERAIASLVGRTKAGDQTSDSSTRAVEQLRTLLTDLSAPRIEYRLHY